MRDYGYVGDYPLPKVNHSTLWLRKTITQVATFCKRGDFKLSSNNQALLLLLLLLEDDNGEGYEDQQSSSNLNTLLQDMVAGKPNVKFHLKSKFATRALLLMI